MSKTEDHIDSILSNRLPPFVIQSIVLVITIVGLYRDFKQIIVAFAVCYYFVNTIFELLTISIDYHQTDFADYENLSFHRKMSLYERKYIYTNVSGIEMNNKKDGRNLVANDFYATLLNSEEPSENVAIPSSKRKLLITIHFCDVKNNKCVKQFCFMIYILGITKKNYTSLSYDEIVEHVDKSKIDEEERYYIKWICFDYHIERYIVSIHNSFSNRIQFSFDYFEIIRSTIESQNNLLKESSESVVTTTLELNKLLLMYLDRIKSNTLSDNILFDMGKILKDKKQVICEHKKELYDGLMSDSASILGPIWASKVKVR
jgi:hypothetical protein